MASPRSIRRMAFLVAYQLDARGEEDAAHIRSSLDDEADAAAGDRDAAFEFGLNVHRARADADAELESLAPGWPAHRQAAVDRAILRVAHYEMVAMKISPKVVINEAVELAKEFSTDKSPAFINGLLDKVMKRVGGESGEAEIAEQPPET